MPFDRWRDRRSFSPSQPPLLGQSPWSAGGYDAGPPLLQRQGLERLFGGERDFRGLLGLIQNMYNRRQGGQSYGGLNRPAASVGGVTPRPGPIPQAGIPVMERRERNVTAREAGGRPVVGGVAKRSGIRRAGRTEPQPLPKR